MKTEFRKQKDTECIINTFFIVLGILCVVIVIATVQDMLKPDVISKGMEVPYRNDLQEFNLYK